MPRDTILILFSNVLVNVLLFNITLGSRYEQMDFKCLHEIFLAYKFAAKCQYLYLVCGGPSRGTFKIQLNIYDGVFL